MEKSVGNCLWRMLNMSSLILLAVSAVNTPSAFQRLQCLWLRVHPFKVNKFTVRLSRSFTASDG
jgi:hypothetical protein